MRDPNWFTTRAAKRQTNMDTAIKTWLKANRTKSYQYNNKRYINESVAVQTHLTCYDTMHSDPPPLCAAVTLACCCKTLWQAPSCTKLLLFHLCKHTFWLWDLLCLIEHFLWLYVFFFGSSTPAVKSVWQGSGGLIPASSVLEHNTKPNCSQCLWGKIIHVT